jgi:hypothetical protein
MSRQKKEFVGNGHSTLHTEERSHFRTINCKKLAPQEKEKPMGGGGRFQDFQK